MNQPRAGRPAGREEPIDDPLLIEGTLGSLHATGAEFSIKVEGTSTLPYASVLVGLDGEGLLVRLVRPLPHELLAGAEFRMIFAVEEQRYEALVTFQSREAYLLYRFSRPGHFFFADRRRHKRYPFRPRESAYVVASDGGFPSRGIAGALVNIGLGGMCLRVDRVLRLDDGLRVPVSTALFERGASFPRIRIQDLPKLPVLEVGGWVTHATERGTEVLVGFDFGELSEEAARALGDSLAFREKLFQARAAASFGESSGSLRAARPRGPGETPDSGTFSTEEIPEPCEVLSDPLSLLRRKACRLMLVGGETPLMESCLQGLRRHGYHRLEILADLEAAARLWLEPARPRPTVVLVDLSGPLAECPEPLAAVRLVERRSAGLQGAQVVILCDRLDPTLVLGQSEGIRFLPCAEEEARWISALDELTGIHGC